MSKKRAASEVDDELRGERELGVRNPKYARKTGPASGQKSDVDRYLAGGVGGGDKNLNSDDDDAFGKVDDDVNYTSKHTLDSDEEDEVKYRKLDIEKVEGQEDAGQEFDDNIRIMPFNMQEDLEEGHFDDTGNFIFDKKEAEIKDAWLDNIDWAHVKADAGEQWNQKNEEDDSTTKVLGDGDLTNIYEKIVSFLQSNETIERAITRIGKTKGLSAAEERKRRWAAKKAGEEYVDDSARKVKDLTGLTDMLVSNGALEAYQYSMEKLKFLINELSNKAMDKLDIFSDEVPSSSKVVGNSDETALESVASEESESSSKSVMWQYKLADNAKIHGPVDSMEMLQMQQEGLFDDEGWARKLGTQTFYSIARLDFEIYT